jgi:hypothetical protein
VFSTVENQFPPKAERPASRNSMKGDCHVRENNVGDWDFGGCASFPTDADVEITGGDGVALHQLRMARTRTIADRSRLVLPDVQCLFRKAGIQSLSQEKRKETAMEHSYEVKLSSGATITVDAINEAEVREKIVEMFDDDVTIIEIHQMQD